MEISIENEIQLHPNAYNMSDNSSWEGDISSESSSNFSSNPIKTWLDIFDKQYLRHNMTWTVALLVLYIIVLIVGIVGNSMVILVVILRPAMRTVTNFFIMNLAVADLFVIVFCVPVTLISNVFTPWILGSFMCKGVAYIQGVSVFASGYSLAAISWDRCKAIYRPLERPRGLSKSQAAIIILLIWLVATLITIPWAVIFNVISSKNNGLSHCVETWENQMHGKIYFFIVNLICCYSLPLILIIISNVIIWCNVTKRNVPLNSASIKIIERLHRRTRHGVRKMLGIVTLTFLLSWLPLYVLVTFVKFSSSLNDLESKLFQVFLPAAQWLGSMNSCINPVLYAFLNTKFRKAFVSLFPTWLVCSKNGEAGQGSLSYGSPAYGRSSFMRASTTKLHQTIRNRSDPVGESRRKLLVSSYRGKKIETDVYKIGSCCPKEVMVTDL